MRDSLGSGDIDNSGVRFGVGEGELENTWGIRQRFAGETGSGELDVKGDNVTPAAPLFPTAR